MAELFVNPYTFVSLRDGKTPNNISPNDKRLSGKIVCTLITKTQLVIPDLKDSTTSEGINKHPFFRVGGKAVIPGSSIRGVIRNAYEALTNSCMHINDKDDDYFSSRQNKLHAGLIVHENGGYVLYKAERLRAMQSDSELKTLKTGDRVSFRKQLKDKEDQSLYHMAYDVKRSDNGEGVFLRVDLFRSKRKDKKTREKVPTQNHPSVFVRGDVEGRLSEKELHSFGENISRYEPKTKETKYVSKDYAACFRVMKKGESILPVWYFIKNGHHYLAPSQFSRTVFISKPKDMLEKMGYSACVSKRDMCEACALFGMISSEKGSTVASHVRFGDAVCVNEDRFDGYYVLPVLGSPRLSSFEFYLKNKNGRYNTVNDRFKKKMFVPIDPDEADTVLSGRKFYWHHKGKKITENDKNAIDIAIRAQQEHKKDFSSKDSCFELVKAGAEFSFEVYFDGITEEQLKKLVYSLNFGDNNVKSRLCHKIGHGKPVGLGSVKICVNSIFSRTFENGNYTVDDVTDKYVSPKAEELFDERDYMQVLKAVCMDTIEDRKLISYPKTTTSEQAFSWFVKNRETMRSGEGMAKVYDRLPDITSKSQTLPIIDDARRGSSVNPAYTSRTDNTGGRNHAADYPHKKYR